MNKTKTPENSQSLTSSWETRIPFVYHNTGFSNETPQRDKEFFQLKTVVFFLFLNKSIQTSEENSDSIFCWEVVMLCKTKWTTAKENAQIQVHPAHVQSLIPACSLHWHIL